MNRFLGITVPYVRGIKGDKGDPGLSLDKSTFVSSSKGRLQVGVSNDGAVDMVGYAIERDRDYVISSSTTLKNMVEVKSFSVALKPGAGTLSSINWVCDTSGVHNITMTMTKMQHDKNNIFVTNDEYIAADGIRTTYDGQITFSILPTYNSLTQQYEYTTNYDKIPNILPLDPDTYFMVTVNYEVPLRTLVYNYTDEISPTCVNVDECNIVIANADGTETKQMRQVVPINMKFRTGEMPPVSMSFTSPNYIQFHNIPSYEYCMKMNISNVLCNKYGVLMISSGNGQYPVLISRGGKVDVSEESDLP